MSASGQRTHTEYWFPKRYADFVQRLRVACGFLLLAAFAWLAEPTRASIVSGLPFSIFGLWLRAWAAGHLAKDRQLAVTGPYAYMRNPLYAGTVMVAAGIVIASRSPWLAAIFVIVFSLVYLPAIELEEHHLRGIFPAYALYANQVHRFLPFVKWKGRTGEFSWTFYRRNEEYKALIGFLFASALLIWKCWFRETAS